MEAVIPAWFEIGAGIVMVLIIVGDLILAYKRPHTPTPRESAIWIGFYVVLALIFAALLYFNGDIHHAGEFLAGWLTEYSLSIDNLFVFLIIMSRFSVPRNLQQEVLMVGIIIALVLRGIFILIGVTLIDNFSWIFYIFGAFLLYTAARQVFSNSAENEKTESGIIRFLRRRIPITQKFDGVHLRTSVGGRRAFTPILIVFVAIGTTDLIFALDSIPAIFGITENAFLVFAANVFALMGLRQLYFLLGNLISRLVYLSYGIALILAFIGVKLVFHAMHDNQLTFINGGEGIEWAPEIGIVVSLCVIVGAMAAATAASLIKLKLDARSQRDAD